MKKNLLIKKNSFIKKLFFKIIRKIGFELIDQNTFAIPDRGLKIDQDLNIFNKKSITIPLGEIKIKKKINSFLIIFRSFTNENKLLSQNKKRIFEKNKTEYTYRSLLSLCKSINVCQKKVPNIIFFLKIIDDNSKNFVISKLKKIIQRFNIKHEISSLNTDKYKHKMKFTNSPRMLAHNSHIYESKIYAKNSNYDLIYFVEDDYLHEENSIIEMLFTYQKFSSILKKDVILCPADYPYLYHKLENTIILPGYNIHWRKVKESLCTYLISKNILQQNWKEYIEMAENNFDPYEKPLHKIYKKFNCFSPIPSLSIHMTNVNSVYGLSIFKNIFKIWKKSKP